MSPQPLEQDTAVKDKHESVPETSTTAANKESDLAGELIKFNPVKKFGFIKQDSQAPDMFVLPYSCPDFGDEVPAASASLRQHVLDFVALEPQRLQDTFGVGDL